MLFQEAIISILHDFDKEILTSSSFMNVLNDYNAFSEEKFIKNVVKLLCENDYINKLVESIETDNLAVFVNQCSYDLYNGYGISKDISISVLNSIIIGLGHDPIKANADVNSKNESNKFEIGKEEEKRSKGYIELLSISYKECGDLLSKQGKLEDAINLYKIGSNNGDSQCLVLLTKLYIENSLIANDHDAKDCCNRYFNSFLDVIGDGVPDISNIDEEILDMYANGFYEIIPVALQHNKTKLFHPNVEFFIIGALGTRLYGMLTEEMESVCSGLEKMNSKHEMGLLKMEDYPHFTTLQQQKESVIEFQNYLRSLIEKIREYNGQHMTLNRIE